MSAPSRWLIAITRAPPLVRYHDTRKDGRKGVAVTYELDMTGRSVLVTGGCRGVGRGIAEVFLAAGADVTVVCRHEPETLPHALGRRAAFVAADLRDDAAASAAIDAVHARNGRLDVLVNNAGGSPMAEAATASARFTTSIVSLNLLAPLWCAQRANHHMQKQTHGGVIVNIGSLSGQRPSPLAAAYGAAKAGLVNLTRSLAVEWAPKVRVNCVVSGMVRTEQSHLHYGDEAGVNAVAATVPLGRLAEPADIGHACLFLASPFASYVSGADLTVHGGGDKPAYQAATTAYPTQ
jgi:NAD(P)-dependent dehydrogenase (short-subunit alcohol dehydrogenase family)